MYALRSIITLFTCFTITVLAYPGGSNLRSLHPQRRRPDCPSGTQFYSCSDGFRGCANYDPCALSRRLNSNSPVSGNTTATSGATMTSNNTMISTVTVTVTGGTCITTSTNASVVTTSSAISSTTSFSSSTTSTTSNTTSESSFTNTGAGDSDGSTSSINPLITSITALFPNTTGTVFSNLINITSSVVASSTTTPSFSITIPSTTSLLGTISSSTTTPSISGVFPNTTTPSFITSTTPSTTTTSIGSTVTVPSSTVPGQKNTTSASNLSCSTTDASNEVSGPTMFNIYPLDPAASEKNVSFLSLQSQGSEIEREQVAYFGSASSDVRTCSLKWVQADAEQRVWVTNGNGRVKITPLVDFQTDQPVSFDSIKSIQSSTSFFVELDESDQVESGNVHQIVGTFPCSGPMAFRLQIDKINGAGNMFMEQDKNNGLFLDYSC